MVYPLDLMLAMTNKATASWRKFSEKQDQLCCSGKGYKCWVTKARQVRVPQGGGLETWALPVGCRGRRKLTQQTDMQLVWWHRLAKGQPRVFTQVNLRTVDSL